MEYFLSKVADQQPGIFWLRGESYIEFRTRSYFHWYMFPFQLIQSANTDFLLMKTRKVLNRSSKWANGVIVKVRCFHNFTINSQSKLKKIKHAILQPLTEKQSRRILIRFHRVLGTNYIKTLVLKFSQKF